MASLALAAAGTAWAGGGYAADTDDTPATSRVGIAYDYACTNGGSIGVRYIASDLDLKRDPVVLEYSGKRHGLALAPAPSASGTRYVGLSGLDTAGGLEWWEHQDEATLSRYDSATGDTVPLTTCRIQL